MARVVALVPDLLFGSRVQSSLRGAGHDVELIGEQARLSDHLRDLAAPPVAVLVVDLTSDGPHRASLVQALSEAGELAGVRCLGFYSHVDTDTRELAEQAGFDMIVPRSRMAREGAELVTRLAGQAPPATR
jgi:DNA-binding NarL/FixJ family response regulator